jgi:Fic family protein
MVRYIHDLPDWPRFRWRYEDLASPLAAVGRRQGRLIGRMEGLGAWRRDEAVLQSLTEETLKSSELDGEALSRDQIRASLARRLGMDIDVPTSADLNVDGAVEMILDATRSYAAPLTARRLLDWHAALFPTGRSGMSRIKVGAWRDDASGPMRAVRGPAGRELVHHEAAATEQVETDMAAFLDWFNTPDGADGVLRAALAHLWFVTIHPFDDGNGRIACAITDMALARSEASPRRFYSLSAQIRIERAAYHGILESTQTDDLDITAWILWFLGCLDRAIDGAEIALASVLAKARFWAGHADAALRDRQRLIVNRLLDGSEGKLTSSKYARLAKCSQDTASRDIDELIARGILAKNQAGGRSTSYSLAPIGP